MPRLNSSLDQFMEVANESLFSQKKTVSQLLASSEKTLARKLKTVGDCEDYLEILKSEASKFNECIRTLQTVKKKYDTGKLDKKDYREQLRGATAILRKNCNKLQIKLGNVVSDTNAITKKDLADFNKYVTGLRKIVMNLKKKLAKTERGSAKESSYDYEMNEILYAVMEDAFDLTELTKDADKDKKKTDDGDEEDSESEFKGEALDEVDDDTDDDDDKKKKKKSKSKKKDDDEDEEDEDKEDDEDSDDEEDDEDDKDKEDDEEDEDSDDEDEKDKDSEEDEEDDDDKEDSDEEDEDKDDKKKKKKTKSKSKKTTKKDDDSDDEDSDEDDEDSKEDDEEDEEKESKESFYSPEVERIAVEMALRNPYLTFDQACQIVDAAEDDVLDDYGDQKATEMADELHSHGVPYEKALEMAFDYLGL